MIAGGECYVGTRFGSSALRCHGAATDAEITAARPGKVLIIFGMMAAAERFSFFHPSKFWLNRRRRSDHRYEPLVGEDEDDDDELSPPEDIMVSQPSDSLGGGGDAGAMAKQVLRKIDRRLIPLLFVTYALNFMDKTILSSASVFGLKDDTVRPMPPHYATMHLESLN